MLTNSRRVRMVAAVVAPTALAVTILGRPAVAETKCKVVEGKFQETAVSSNSAFSPACTAAANGLCTTGPIVGDLHGTYNFALTGDNELAGGAAAMENPALVGSFPPFPASVIHFTGRDVVQTDHGNLFGAEAGALDTSSPGNYGDLMTITGGTGKFAGATGQLHLFGNFDLGTGMGSSRYAGVVCTP